MLLQTPWIFRLWVIDGLVAKYRAGLNHDSVGAIQNRPEPTLNQEGAGMMRRWLPEPPTSCGSGIDTRSWAGCGSAQSRRAAVPEHTPEGGWDRCVSSGQCQAG